MKVARAAHHRPSDARALALASRVLSRAIRLQRRLSSPLGQFRAGRPTVILRNFQRRPPTITSLLPDTDARPLMRAIFFEWTASHTPRPAALPDWLATAYRAEVFEDPAFDFGTAITDAEWDDLLRSHSSRASGPGPSGLRFTHILRVPVAWQQSIRAYLDSCLTASSVPEVLSRALLYPIPKGSAATSVSDLRPISMMETLLKLLTQLLFTRLLTALAPRLSPFQFGFTPGRTCADAVSVLRCAMDDALERGVMLDLLDFDFSRLTIRWSGGPSIVPSTTLGSLSPSAGCSSPATPPPRR